MDRISGSLTCTCPHSMRQSKKNLVPLKQSKALCAQRPDRGWAVYYHKTNEQGMVEQARRFFRHKSEADAFCSEMKAEKVSLGNLAFGLDDELKREALSCINKLKPFGKSLTQAVEYFIRDQNLLNQSFTVQKAAEELYNRHKADGSSQRHLQAIRLNLQGFCIQYGAEKVSTIRPDKVQLWLDNRKTKEGLPISSNSFNTIRRYLGLFFNFCVKRGWMEQNPILRIDGKTVKSKTVRLLSPSDLKQILNAANSRIKPAIVVQAYCGLRVAEVARLEWSDLLSSGHLQISAEKAKTARRRITPIPEKALRYLLSVRKHTGFIFGDGEKPTIDALQVALREVKSACSGVRWHRNALRASALSYRLAETQDAPKTALEMGNSPSVLLRDYRELTTPEVAREWFDIDPFEPLKEGPVIAFEGRKKKRKAD